MDTYEAATDAARMGWYLSSGSGEELFAVNPSNFADQWVYTEGKWFQGNSCMESIPLCKNTDN